MSCREKVVCKVGVEVEVGWEVEREVGCMVGSRYSRTMQVIVWLIGVYRGQVG